jgi:hypothetical protein
MLKTSQIPIEALSKPASPLSLDKRLGLLKREKCKTEKYMTKTRSRYIKKNQFGARKKLRTKTR